MLTLGIWSFGPDSSAVLLDDTSVLAAIEEEKLNRSSGAGGIPRLAIKWCLEQRGVNLSDVEIVAFPGRLLRKALREAKFQLRLGLSRPGASDWTRSIGGTFREFAQLAEIRRLAGKARSFLHLEHHLCHAASAYYPSEFDRALILTLDENGDMWSGLIAAGENEEIRPLRSLRFPNSLGWFHSRVTEFLGFRPRLDEHKVQWLSKDGQPEFVQAFRKLFRRGADGLPALELRYFGTAAGGGSAFSSELGKELGLHPAAIASDTALRASLARSARDVIEEIVLEIAAEFRKRTNMHSICLAGGLFLNAFLVRALETRGGFERVYVQPVSGNSGTSLGAALLARKHAGGKARQRLSHLCLGPGFAAAQIKPVLDNSKIIYKYASGEEQLCAEVAQLLRRDKIVAWCQGRTEFGHRALGHRSILASPFSEYVIENVNTYIKHRQDFHPFGLSVPAEIAPDLFEFSPNCTFMASLGILKKDVPGLARFTFDGGQVRVHVVEREANPRFWRLLHKFGEYAPAPVLVNTSFNLFGEPLVSDPREALRSFYCAGIDALALGDFLLVK